jgi:hypothetical protein
VKTNKKQTTIAIYVRMSPHTMKISKNIYLKLKIEFVFSVFMEIPASALPTAHGNRAEKYVLKLISMQEMRSASLY